MKKIFSLKYLLSFSLLIIGILVFSKEVFANTLLLKQNNLMVCTNATCSNAPALANPSGTGKLVVQGDLGVGKLPTVDLDVLGSIQTSGNVSMNQTYFTNTGHVLRETSTQNLDILSASGTNVGLSITSSPVVWYQFSEGSGTVALDSAANAVNGTYYGSPTWNTGKLGNAIVFNGSNYMQLPSNATLNAMNGDFYLSAWIYRIGAGNQQIINKNNAGNSGGFALLVGNSGEVYCRTSNGTTAVDSFTTYANWVPVSTWVHIAVVKSGTSCRVYVNGVDRTSTAGSHTLATNALALTIGSRNDGSEKFNGRIDEVKVYNYILSANQILSDASQQSDLPPTGYFYGSASGVGILTPNREWAYFVDPNKSSIVYGQLLTPVNGANNTLIVGSNGANGYTQVGGSGWYDDGTYFNMYSSQLGAYPNRNLYITTATPISYLYSLSNYFGDNSVGPTVQFRNSNLTGNGWGINNTSSGYLTLTSSLTIDGGTSQGLWNLQGDNQGGASAWYDYIYTIKNSDTSGFYWGYSGSDTLRLVYGPNNSVGPWTIVNEIGQNGNYSVPGTALIFTGSTTAGVITNGGGGADTWLRLFNYNPGGTYSQFAVGPFYAAGAVRFDLAEVTPVDPSEDLVLGEIVTTDPTHSVRLHRSQDKYQSDIIGVVSNVWTASMTIGGDTGPEKLDSSPDRRPIALAGRVTTLVNLESGPIKTGDSITSSSTAGTGMKASNAGVVVSKAMEDFDGTKVNSVGVQEVVDKLRTELKEPGRWTDAEKASLEKTIGRLTSPLPKGTGRIISFINVHDYDPDTKIANLDDYKLKDDTLTNSKGNLITRLGAFSQTVVGKMVAGEIQVKHAIVNGIDLMSEYQTQSNRLDRLESQVKNLKGN